MPRRVNGCLLPLMTARRATHTAAGSQCLRRTQSSQRIAKCKEIGKGPAAVLWMTRTYARVRSNDDDGVFMSRMTGTVVERIVRSRVSSIPKRVWLKVAPVARVPDILMRLSCWYDGWCCIGKIPGPVVGFTSKLQGCRGIKPVVGADAVDNTSHDNIMYREGGFRYS
ncbi:hypothetical protein GGS23DRAFT_9943 [Durotheca rogersii]|uniref:uncharacterized protein n=1 Tax=Durotheca rogersii TaxID=419775 RepID=UPI00221E9621|nr:uncharacterized protein GGS23DRAFT_9943 [Durotheca rogersii]KAI5868068.1 hypothetical protein GGS23DRAFT_9943 [Durotheca rogersii]